jgi:hypothetical protein
MKYKCIKPLSVQKCDDDGFEIENKYFWVDENSIWQTSDESFIGGEIHLDSKKGWLEVSNETLKEYFEPIKEVNHE